MYNGAKLLKYKSIYILISAHPQGPVEDRFLTLKQRSKNDRHRRLTRELSE